MYVLQWYLDLLGGCAALIQIKLDVLFNDSIAHGFGEVSQECSGCSCGRLNFWGPLAPVQTQNANDKTDDTSDP